MGSAYELSHYGVLGMKWGVRKDRQSKARKSKRSSDYLEARKLRKKAAGGKNLSNAEIRKVVERMNLEKQYKNLSKREISNGERWVRRVINTVAFGAAVKLTKTVAEGFAEGFKKGAGRR